MARAAHEHEVEIPRANGIHALEPVNPAHRCSAVQWNQRHGNVDMQAGRIRGTRDMTRTIGTVAAPSAPESFHFAPAVIDAVADAAYSEDALVADALGQLGHAMPNIDQVDPTGGMKQLQRLPLVTRFAGEEAAAMSPSAALSPHRVAALPVGTSLSTGPGPDDAWTVVAVGPSDRVRLAQRTPEGALRTTTRRWASLVERNPNLLDAAMRDARDGIWNVVDVDGSVPRLGRDAPVGIMSTEMSHIVRWGDVLRETGLARRRPVAVTPRSAEQAASLRGLVGDRRFVVSRVGNPDGLRDALAATESLPGTSQAALDELTATQQWFRDTAGMDVWRADQRAIVVANSQDYLANAAASVFRGDAFVFEGPRSPRVRGDWLTEVDGDDGRALRRNARLINDNNLAVRTHEAGHVAIMRSWGESEVRTSAIADDASRSEDAIVQEAFADLFGASRVDKPSVGVRRLATLQNGMGTFDQLRARLASRPPSEIDVHFGTQLLTRPMVEVQRELGSERLAEITGAAVRDIGGRIADGTVVAVDLPLAAQALRDATAWRVGDAHPLVRHLDEAWRALRVFH
jgi:hypothetical protein